MSESGRGARSLKRVAIFASLDPEALRRLESRCRWRTYRPGKEVIAFKGTATDVYFLTSGRARVIIHAPTGKDVAFRTIRPGDIFGEFAAIDDQPRSASVEILEPSVVASMPSWHFRNAIVDEPNIAMALLLHLTAESRRLTARILEFSTLAVRNRIHAELLRLAGENSSPETAAVIKPAPTHSAIASRVSTHREAVTRELNRLAGLSLVERRGNALIIKDMARLAEMVQDAKGE